MSLVVPRVVKVYMRTSMGALYFCVFECLLEQVLRASCNRYCRFSTLSVVQVATCLPICIVQVGVLPYNTPVLFRTSCLCPVVCLLGTFVRVACFGLCLGASPRNF